MRVTNRLGDMVTIFENETEAGYVVWNHEWRVKLIAGSLEEAWSLVEYNVESLCDC